jgi:predicted MPP superfamily phosphohydrolase
LIIIIILVLLIDLYAFQAVRTVFDSAPFIQNPAAIAYWAISIGVYILIVVGMFSYFSLGPGMKRFILGAVICIGIAKLFIVSFLLIDDGVRLIKLTSSLFTGGRSATSGGQFISRSEFLTRSALVTGGLILGLFAWGMVRTAYQFKIRRESLIFPGLKEGFSGLKIVQISDAHVGSFLNTEPVETAVRMINELEPDLVFFTGDLVNSRASEAEPFIQVFSGIKARYGVYSVLGNHDYSTYYNWASKEEAEANMERMHAIHGEIGWTLLNNENRIIDVDGSRIAVIGVENWGASRHFPKAGDLVKAKSGTEDAHLKLLLSHDPTHWSEKVTAENEGHQDIAITFSGHTHGFQMGVEIPWLNIKWSPSKYVYKQWAGLYQRGKQYLYVNRGLGFIGYHGRVGILPEITLMEISRA